MQANNTQRDSDSEENTIPEGNRFPSEIQLDALFDEISDHVETIHETKINAGDAVEQEVASTLQTLFQTETSVGNSLTGGVNPAIGDVPSNVSVTEERAFLLTKLAHARNELSKFIKNTRKTNPFTVKDGKIIAWTNDETTQHKVRLNQTIASLELRLSEIKIEMEETQQRIDGEGNLKRTKPKIQKRSKRLTARDIMNS